MHRFPKTIFFMIAAQLGVVGTVSAQPYAYVSNLAGNNLSVVNTADYSVVGSIPVPKGPTGLAVTPDGSKVYVASQSANTVSVISTATKSVIASIGVGATPTRVAVSPNGAQVYVVSQGANQIDVIDTGSQTVVGTIAVGAKPTAVAFNPAGTRAYVANVWSGDVSVIDTASQTVVATIVAASGPSGVATSPDGRLIYVTNQYSGTVTVHNASSGDLVATVGGLTFPNAIAVTPNGARLFVTNGNAATVSAIDTSSNSAIATIAVGSLPTSVAVSPDGNRAYVTNQNGFSLSAIDTGNNSVVTTIAKVGVYPVFVAMQPAAAAGAPAPTCNYTISPGNTSYPSSGGNGTAGVSVSNGCPWSASSNNEWISIPPGASGNGNGTFPFSVSANTSTSGRSGTITLAGQSFTISQSGITCTYTLSSPGTSVTAGGGSASVTVTTPDGCSWNVSSDSSWLVPGTYSGSGTGSISFQASGNPGLAVRTGNLNIGGQNFSVTEAGVGFSAIRVNCGGPAITDPSGNLWSADDGNNRSITGAPIAGTDFPALYQTESWSTGTLRYQFAVPNGTFTVKLRFAEIYLTQAGSRKFDILINGTPVYPGLDILAHTGPNTAYDQTFGVTVTGGQLAIQLVPIVGTPKLSGIEVY